MKTGTTNIYSSEICNITEHKIEAILITLMEKAFILAGSYINASNRNTITEDDLIYALQWCAHDFFSDDNLEEDFEKNFNSIKNLNDNNDTSDNDTSDNDTSDNDTSDNDTSDNDTDDSFVRVENSTNTLIIQMNKYHDEWENWVPDDPIKNSIKNAINKCILVYKHSTSSN
jgi:hypothetical protein